VNLIDTIKEGAAIRRRNEARRVAEVKKQRKLKHVATEIALTLEAGREAWRRFEALPSTQPTPERASKALEIGSKVVNAKVVKTVKTTADLIQDRNPLGMPRHLRWALDTFCAAVATAMGAQVDDWGSGSHKLIADYSGMPAGEYGPREIPDRVLNARFLWKTVEREMPAELMAVAEQLVSEETGLLQGRPASLSQYGERMGYRGDKQAATAGSVLAYAACSVLNHALRKVLRDHPVPA
jgi:hypothetical protein